MTALSISYPSFTSGTTIVSAQVNQNNTDIVNYINARNGATANWDAVSTVGAFTSTLTSNQIILGTTRTVTISAGTPASSSRTWTIPDITGNGTFAALEGTQTFTGAKTVNNATLVQTISTAGTTADFQVNNTDNSNGASNARHLISTGGASGGDALINWLITGATNWSMGIDNSDSDALIISESASLGTTNRFRMPSGGQMQLVDGSVSAASPGYISEINTGWYRLGSAQLACTLGGTKRLDMITSQLTWYGVTNGYIGIDRNANTSQSLTVFQTAGTGKAAVGMTNDSTDNLGFFVNSSLITPSMTLNTNGDLYSTTFTDYSSTSTVTGWTSFTTKLIFYKKIGKLVWVWFNIAGTSNATNAQFTLPFTNANSVGVLNCCQSKDNGGTSVAGGVNIDPNTALAFMTPTLGAGGSGWTASGTKSVNGQCFYQTT